MIKGPRGTNDILPPVSLNWQYVEAKARNIFKLYNYQEIRTPIFEYTELFARGIGEVTDIVEKEMYTFMDKGERSITLRPEGTAPVVRSFLENKIYGRAQPTKYYYLGPMFRYERPQAGRYRQFHQIGVEALGSNDPFLDAEVIALGMNLMAELGLKEQEVLLNSIGCTACRPNYIIKLKNYVTTKQDQFCEDCRRRKDENPLRILDCKQKDCRQLRKEAPQITDYLCEPCHKHFFTLQENLRLLKIDFTVQPDLVRGLDYYTNTAFEVKYKGLGAQNTIFGGGRYNGLTEEIGRKSIPGIGFAMGMERLLLALRKQNIKLPVTDKLDLFIITIGNQARRYAFELNNQLRKAGYRAEMDYLDRSVRSQMKAANRNNATFTIIIGDDELEKRVVTLHNMESGRETEVKLENVINTINSHKKS